MFTYCPLQPHLHTLANGMPGSTFAQTGPSMPNGLVCRPEEPTPTVYRHWHARREAFGVTSAQWRANGLTCSSLARARTTIGFHAQVRLSHIVAKTVSKLAPNGTECVQSSGLDAILWATSSSNNPARRCSVPDWRNRNQTPDRRKRHIAQREFDTACWMSGALVAKLKIFHGCFSDLASADRSTCQKPGLAAGKQKSPGRSLGCVETGSSY